MVPGIRRKIKKAIAEDGIVLFVGTGISTWSGIPGWGCQICIPVSYTHLDVYKRQQLYIHRNTLVYRLDKLQKSTGLDLRIFEDAITFKIALMVAKYMKYMESLDY